MNPESLVTTGQALEQPTFLFGEFAFAAGDKVLWQAGELVALAPKTCELLAAFIEHAGRLLTKEELLNKIWADAYVEESNLSHHVAALRKTLGEQKNGKKFIETVPRKGYRFVAPVTPQNKLEIIVTERTKTRIIEEEIESPENPLIGRERELSVIKNLLRRRDVGILTLTGSGGAGKTSLAQVVIAELAAAFADGVFFIDLSAQHDSAMVVPVIAQMLGVKESGDVSALGALKDHLREKEMLLVLDNFEQVIDAAAQIAVLAAGASKLKILVTSRIRLRLKTEREYAVPPLELPAAETLPEELAEYASVGLFVERARRAKPNFYLTDENAVPIAEICRRLEGLPLAIELAAARVRLLSPQSILERLEHQLKFLIGGTRDLPARQQTMHAAIAWSYELLNVNEKRFFEELAVFSGGFTLEASEAVSSFLEVDALELIDLLLEQNLLLASEQPDGEMRFRLLEVVREFARENLYANPFRENIESRHAEYFLSLAEEIEPDLRSQQANEIYGKFKIEHDNLRAALDYFRAQDAEKYLRLATAMGLFWGTHAYFTEGRWHLEEALQKAAPQPSRQRALANKSAAIIAYKQGDYQAAQNFHSETLREAQLLADEHLQAIALNGLGTVSYLRGELDAAQSYFEQGLATSRRFGDGALTLAIIVGLSEVKKLAGDWQAARALTHESLVYINERGLKRPFVGAQLNLGVLAFMENDFAAAEDHFRTARDNAQADDRHALSLCLDGFAALATQKGNIERALELAAEAHALRDEIGYQLELPDRIFREKYLQKLNELAAVQ